MTKSLVIVILIVASYLVFFLSLLSKPPIAYKHNRALSISIYSKNTPEVKDQMEKIKNNPEWLAQVKRQSKIKGLSIPSMIQREAKSFLNINLSKISEREKVRIRIENDSLWFAQIQIQAKERNVSLEKMIEGSIDYILDNKNKK